MGQPSLSALLKGSMDGALVRYRVMTFIVGSALVILVFVGVPLQLWAPVLSGFVPFLAFVVEHRVYRQMQQEWTIDGSGQLVEIGDPQPAVEPSGSPGTDG